MAELLDANGNPLAEAPAPVEATEPEAPVVDETVEVEDSTEEVDPRIAERKDNAKAAVENCEYGYLVGINNEGGLTFQEVGSKQGYIQLLGLHEFAEQRLQVMSDTNLQYGAALVSTQVHQLTELVKVLLNMQTNAAKGQVLGAMKR